ncbi:MAG: hypothetical protein AVDCRST_MAG93-7314 [uncultured Chloroflexia bacterium]|uniref:Uncharacterized protein n=1 Tax=uncultured Chloroflexia bacterium TaxID=1672391 RepID=A0A6J4MB93_9CHLR|nr:MAG: hypothetical protein AVDCRST_MAG93-7314 [uncultured Chloroflexia bacterium]
MRQGVRHELRTGARAKGLVERNGSQHIVAGPDPTFARERAMTSYPSSTPCRLS